MFVDPGLSILLTDHLNRWLRKRNRPHGVSDLSLRGVRLVYNRTYRFLSMILCLVVLGVASLLCFLPDIFYGQSSWVVAGVVAGWAGILALGVYIPMIAFRGSAVVSDDGVVKFGAWGTPTAELKWHEISNLQVNLFENVVVLTGQPKSRLKLSLCYDGWSDFLEYASRYLEPRFQRILLTGMADMMRRRK